MSTFLTQFERDLALRNLRPSTRNLYLGRVRAFTRHFGRCPSKMGEAEVREFLHHLVARGNKPSTINLHHSILRFVYGTTLGRPEVMACVPRAIPRPNPRIPPLTTPEVRAVLKAVGGDVYEHAIVTTLLETGLRRSELCGLQVTDIDRKAGYVHVREGKGGRPRIVNLSERLYSCLRLYWKACRPHRPWVFNARHPGAPKQTCLVPPWQNQPLQPNTLDNLLGRVGKRAGLRRNLSAHDFRRTYATLLLEQGVHRSTLQSLLGHASPTTTDRYLTVRPTVIHRVPSPLARVYGDAALG